MSRNTPEDKFQWGFKKVPKADYKFGTTNQAGESKEGNESPALENITNPPHNDESRDRVTWRKGPYASKEEASADLSGLLQELSGRGLVNTSNPNLREIDNAWYYYFDTIPREKRRPS